MHKKILVFVLFVFGWVALPSLPTRADYLDGADQAQRQMVIRNLNQMPLAFTENQGQFGEKVCFRANTPQSSFFFLPGEVIYQFTRRYHDESDYFSQLGKWYIDPLQSPFETRENSRLASKVERLCVKAKFIGANPKPEIVGEELMDYKCNYFIGNDPTKWRTDVPNYSAVRYLGIYAGIDLRYYGNGRSLKYDFIVKSGADPSRIEIEYDGVNSLSVNANGELMVSTPFGDVIERVPYAYQEIGGDKREIPCRYVIRDRGRFGFVLEGDYDKNKPLCIDPELSYSTFLGGSSDEIGFGIVVDDDGNAYVTGTTSSSNFPTTAGVFDITYNGGLSDVFVTKLNPTGSALVYSTFLGGDDRDDGWAIALDDLGNAYVTGQTVSSNFPTTVGAYDRIHNGTHDVFVTKLNPTGSALVYSTFLGGTDYDEGYGIALDEDGNAYVTGETQSSSFPTTAGAYDQSYNGNYDVFVTKLNPTGSALVYSTFLGGTDYDEGSGIALDNSRNAHVVGGTSSSNFPTTPGAYDQSHNGSGDVFVTKLNPTGSALIYSTFLGGSAHDGGEGIALDYDGNACVTGFTNSSNFPTTPGAYDQSHNGGEDVFVTKLNPTGSVLVYSTFLGGSGYDEGFGIVLDDYCNAYVTGGTTSTNFPTTPEAFDTTHNGGDYDAFVTKLNPTGTTLLYSTFLGGNGHDVANNIALDDYYNPYVTGSTSSNNFPTTHGVFDSTYNGGSDVFVAKIAFGPPPVGYWRFDEGSGSTAYDETDNNNDGTISGATWTTGFSGSALYFHGGGQWFDGDVVTVPNSSSLDINGEFTVEAWIKATGSDNYLVIVDKYQYQNPLSRGFTLYLTTGRLRFGIYSGSHGSGNCSGTSDLRDTTWHHVAGTWDGGYMRVYVDCQMEGEVAWTCPPASTTNNLGIGKRLSGWGGYMPFLGTIDEVRICSSGGKCGDCTGDGVVDISDIVCLINYLFIHGPAPVPLSVGDVTCDGVVDVSDTVYLLNYLFVGGPAPCS